jgi:hypothetical protein
MHDFNRANISETDTNKLINGVLDAAAATEEREAKRPYLGASIIGSECLRKIQWDWELTSTYPAQKKLVFERGHAFEEIAVKAFAKAAFRIERGTSRTGFSAVGELFRGHCDGIMLSGPLFLQYPCLWEHKALKNATWNKIEKDGVKVATPYYYDQVQLYMAYLELCDNPCVFTVTNADSCERLHELIPFDAVAAQAASDRAVTVIKARQHGELLPRIANKPSDWRCNMCDHKKICWAND